MISILRLTAGASASLRSPLACQTIPSTLAMLRRFCSILPGHASFPWNAYPERIKQLETEILTCPQQVEKALVNELKRATIQQNHLKTSKTPTLSQKIFDVIFGGNKNTAPVKIEAHDSIASVVVSTKGIKESMEDAHLVDRFTLLIAQEKKIASVTAVFDGHGGAECAQFATRHLTKSLIKYIEAYNKEGLSNLGIWNSLTLALVDLSQSYNPFLFNSWSCDPSKTAAAFNEAAGTTANLVLTIDQTIWIANVGDSRAIIVKPDGSCQQLSEDAKAGLLRYKTRVDERQGKVVYSLTDVPRINGELAVGGSLGDHNLNGAVSARPAITKLDATHLEKGSLLLQASDGLWDIFTSEEAAEFCTRLSQKGHSTEFIAEELIQSAYQKGSIDNITVLISAL